MMRAPGHNAPHRDAEDPQGLLTSHMGLPILKGEWMDPEWAEWQRAGTNAPKHVSQQRRVR